MWLWKKAPGVRSSEGCPTKLMPFTPSLSKYIYICTQQTHFMHYILVLIKTDSSCLVNLTDIYIGIMLRSVFLTKFMAQTPNLSCHLYGPGLKWPIPMAFLRMPPTWNVPFYSNPVICDNICLYNFPLDFRV